jgi:hypothetical protein
MDRLDDFLRRDSAKKAFDVTLEPMPETTMEASKYRRWKPVTFRPMFLFAVILVTLGLLALVQILIVYDDDHDGILFAPKVSELGAGHIFLYRYLPTIISVSYGLIWHWIDIDARRIEPYRQLSKPNGAKGSDSLCLKYPTDLLAFVPLKALKRGHWPVVIASSTLVLVGMGLTPLQAAIFATDGVTKSFNELMLLSTQQLSVADQASQITANYTFSVANIVWLDERLPPYMTREAAFIPFKPTNLEASHDNETWTTKTTSFSVDVSCEPAILGSDEKWTSSHGCHVPSTFGPPINDIIGETFLEEVIKEYTPFFAGYSGDGGNVNYYLEPYCPEEAYNVFMVALRRNRKSANDPRANMTRLFCETAYHQKAVEATVRRVGGSVLGSTDIGSKTQLPSTIFNTSIFQAQISNARQTNGVRGALPSLYWPDQRPQLQNLPISLSGTYTEMTNIFGLAIGAFPRDFKDYMDPAVLSTAFQAAHRLLFARAMVDVLDSGYEVTETTNGTRTYHTEAVRIVSRFAYAVEGVLGLIIFMAAMLIAVTWCDKINLRADPDSLSALMLLVKGQPGILDQFSHHDQSSWALLKAETSGSIYTLERPYNTSAGTLKLKDSLTKLDHRRQSHVDEDIPDFKYPIEFSKAVGFFFVLALTAVLAGTLYLFQSSRGRGLALPMQNRFVRQLLENYLPTAIATLIEPVWVVLNRLLCLFQPFEELHKGKVSAQRSIDLKYSSLPPQFVMFKAMRAKHFILSAVCAMALFANILAVAFSGLLDERTLSVGHDAKTFPTYDARLKEHISNSSLNINPFPFYYAMANFTSGTPMPQWTGDAAFHLPVSYDAQLNQSDHLKLIDVPTLAARLDCDQVGLSHGSSWSFGRGSFANTSTQWTNLTVSLPNPEGNLFTCTTKDLYMGSTYLPWPCSSKQMMAVELIAPLMSPAAAESGAQPAYNDACQGLIIGVWARKSASDMCEENSYDMADDQAMAMVCKAEVMVQSVNVTLNGDHYVLDDDSEASPSVFSGSDELIREASHALWTTLGSENRGLYNGGTWHNDSFPSDWHNYVMNSMAPDAGLLDPTMPLPIFEETAVLFTQSYQKLFAIWLGLDHERLLSQTTNESTAINATIVRPEIRIVVSYPMMILSSIILGLYIVVAIAVYARRPGKFLPRLPLNMASDIALFAASKAVTEMDEDKKSTQESGADWKRFGYGSFIGTDGRPHVGVERAPFVVST